MAWTQDDLDAIERAIASGTTRVRYKDREVQYASLEDLMRIRRLMLDELNPGKTKTRYPSFDRDL
jgi:hypothetical protein